MVSAPFLFSAPGKVILFGEHAAVYGKPAIAAALSLRTYLLVTPKEPEDHTITLEFADIGFSHSWNISELPWEQVTPKALVTDELIPELVGALQLRLKDIKLPFQVVAAYAFLYLYMCLTPRNKPLCGTFLMKSTLPIGAGLGSSAAISVCLAAALLTLNGKIEKPISAAEEKLELQNFYPADEPPQDWHSDHENESDNESDLGQASVEIIDHWAFISEKCIHGNPSGIDNAVSSHGGAVMFQRTNVVNLPNIRTAISIPPIKLLLTNTKHPRSTADLVAGVGRLSTLMPQTVSIIMDAIENCAKHAFTLMHSNFDSSARQQIRNLVRINHGLLVSLGVSHPTLEEIKSVADTLNIGETKLTGAGGGGCAITLLKDDITENQILEFKTEMEKGKGFDVFSTSLGGKGVACFGPSDLDTSRKSNVFDANVFLKLSSIDVIEKAIGPEANEWRYW